MRLVCITKNNLKQAVRVAKAIFPNEWHSEEIKDFKRLGGELVFWPEYAYEGSILEKAEEFKYYLATIIINKKERVIGITGHYTEDIEGKDNGIIWLGWFGVLEKYRGKGYGKELLEKSINKVKKFKGIGLKQRFKELRLYTTKDEKHEAKARLMYRKRGFKQYRMDWVDGVPCIWLKLDLIEDDKK